MTKITRKGLVDMIEAGLTKKEMADQLLISVPALNERLYRMFQRYGLREIKKMLENGQDVMALSETQAQFENPLASYDIATGIGYSRLDEHWESRGIA